MARQPRRCILQNGAFAHIYSRALDNRFIFHDNHDFCVFRALLGRAATPARLQIYHYCLMHSHFHFLLQLPDLELFSRAMKDLKQGYAQWYAKRHGKRGPVWWGRFGSRPILSDGDLYTCGLYVEMNPVKAGLVRQARQWPYSSARHYAGGRKDPLLTPYTMPPASVRRFIKRSILKGGRTILNLPANILASALRHDNMNT